MCPPHHASPQFEHCVILALMKIVKKKFFTDNGRVSPLSVDFPSLCCIFTENYASEMLGALVTSTIGSPKHVYNSHHLPKTTLYMYIRLCIGNFADYISRRFRAIPRHFYEHVIQAHSMVTQ